MKDQLKKISIRGRMALGINCLYKALTHFGYKEDILRILMERLAEFVEKDRLDIWEDRIKDVAPYAILDDHPDNKLTEYETISYDDALTLKNSYESMPTDFTDLIDDVINIGESNLYGDVGEYSSNSLNALLSALSKMEKFDLSLPDLTPYLVHSPFTENSGWGYIKPITIFLPVSS